jgi:hypothetical protein
VEYFVVLSAMVVAHHEELPPPPPLLPGFIPEIAPGWPGWQGSPPPHPPSETSPHPLRVQPAWSQEGPWTPPPVIYFDDDANNK